MELPNNSKRILPNDTPKPLHDSLLGLTALNQGVILLDYGPVIIRKNYKELTTIRFLSGGLAGNELSRAIFVGKGMLTAAIIGDEAAPSSKQILRTIKELSEGDKSGIFVIAQPNSELFNFGLAVERANVNCQIRTKLLTIDDNKSSGAVKERISCGFIILTKILGAMAESGAVYDDILHCYNSIVDSIATVSLNYADDEMEDERHSIRLSIDFKQHFYCLIDKKSESQLALHPSIPTVALINTSKSLERMAEFRLVKQVIERLKQLGVCIIRMYVGSFAPVAPSIASLTIMNVLNNKIIDYLDAPCEAPGWHQVIQYMPQVTLDNEIPGILTSQGKQNVPLRGPKLSEKQGNVLLKSVQFACDALVSCEKQLNVIDAEKSRGNVGSRLRNMAQYVNKRLNNKQMPIHCPYAFLKKLSVITETAVGGTMGSIYGIFFESGANVFGDMPAGELITAVTWCKALTAATDAIRSYCNQEMQFKSMFYPIKACEVSVRTEMENDVSVIQCYGFGVGQAEEAAQRTRLPHNRYADAGAHAVGIWMRAVFEGVKLFCSDSTS